MASRNVLHVNEAKEQAELMAAISQCIAIIQREHDCTLIDIAETINCTVVTISNAYNRKSILSTAYLQRLGRAYGGHVLNPYLSLIGGHYAPNESEIDPQTLQVISDFLGWYAASTNPNSPGGASIIHVELLAGEGPADRMARVALAVAERARQIRAGVSA